MYAVESAPARARLSENFSYRNKGSHDVTVLRTPPSSVKTAATATQVFTEKNLSRLVQSRPEPVDFDAGPVRTDSRGRAKRRVVIKKPRELKAKNEKRHPKFWARRPPSTPLVSSPAKGE